MIAEQNPFVGKFTAANARFDDGVRLHAGVHVHFHVNSYSAGEAIGDGQSALPILRRFRAVHVFEKRLGVAPRERERGNFRERTRFFGRDVFCPWDRGPAGCGGIAGNDVIVSYRAALNVTFRTPRAIGENLSFRVAIFRWVGINEQSGRAFTLGGERLEAAIAVRIRIADENDLAFHADVISPQEIVIFRIAAVCVDHFGGHVAGS